MPYKPYVPRGIGELLDHLAHMRLASPTFKDETGYLPRENIDTAFYSLNEGLLAIRRKLGDERYAALMALSGKIRALFEADPDDTIGDARVGRQLIYKMEDVLRSISKGMTPK
jgi:hypothetical protein